MSLINTRIQNIRSKANLGKNEFLRSRYGALEAFKSMTDDPSGIISSELKRKARSSVGSVLQTPVIDYKGDVQIGNVRTLTIEDSENTSNMVNITFATYTFGFTQVPTLFHNNEIAMGEDFEKKMLACELKLGDTLESAALAVLAAKKTKVIKNGLLYDTTTAPGVVAADFYKREYLLGDLGVIQRANGYPETLHIIGDPGVESMVRHLAQEDIYNDKNKRNEYAGKVFHFTDHIAPTDGVYAQGYAVPAGNLGLLFQFDREALLGTKMDDGHEWGIATLPYLGLPCSTYYYESVGNQSGIAGAASADMVVGRKLHFGFAVDVAFMTPYCSDADNLAQAIMGFKIGIQQGDTYASPVYQVNAASAGE